MPDAYARLVSAQVTFHTHPDGDDLDGNTVLRVVIKDAGNFRIAQFDDITGGFPDDSHRTKDIPIEATGTRGRLIDQPGTVTFEIDPHGGAGHDRWDFHPDVVLGFQGSDGSEETVTFSKTYGGDPYFHLVNNDGTGPLLLEAGLPPLFPAWPGERERTLERLAEEAPERIA